MRPVYVRIGHRGHKGQIPIRQFSLTAFRFGNRRSYSAA